MFYNIQFTYIYIYIYKKPTNLRIAPRISCQNTPKSIDADLGLEGLVLRQRAMQVALDLLHGK